jgi:hypothetical protein
VLLWVGGSSPPSALKKLRKNGSPEAHTGKPPALPDRGVCV